MLVSNMIDVHVYVFILRKHSTPDTISPTFIICQLKTCMQFLYLSFIFKPRETVDDKSGEQKREENDHKESASPEQVKIHIQVNHCEQKPARK